MVMDEIFSTTYIIAEIGVNHDGNLALAKQLIGVAKDAGADAVKFQAFIPELLQGTGSQLDMLKPLAFDRDQFVELEKAAVEADVDFMSSVFDVPSMDLVMGLVNSWKIPSGEIVNIPLLEQVNLLATDVYVSTGMSTLGEVELALLALGDSSVTLLHCVSLYPAPAEDMNLTAIKTLYEAFRRPVGLSDHSLGIVAPVMAIALGATVIEKHLTWSSLADGPDHKASMDPPAFREMVQAVRRAEQMLGDGIKLPAEAEIEMRGIARRGEVSGLRGGG